MNKRNLLSMMFTMLLPIFVYGQSISGTVASEKGEPLVGANVVVNGTDLGAAANVDGVYSIKIEPGSYTVTASVIGYKSTTKSIDVSGDETLDFGLIVSVVEMSALEVLASRADEKTPVAYTTVSKEDMEIRLGSQDIPMALNTTPSVYATQQGGGAGDARINVRGFNQRNVAVMINGVPQNDMENGWVYWSNWDVWTVEDRGIQHDWDMFDKDNALVRFRGAMDCAVTNCDLRNSGGSGIRIDLYGKDIKITNNKIFNLGGTGVLLCGYGPGNKDVNKGHLVQNNEIHHIGQLFWHSPAVFIWQSGENRILNNYIHDLPYDAVVLSESWRIILR